MASNDSHSVSHGTAARSARQPGGCSATTPGHATNLTGVKHALALEGDAVRGLVDARIDGITGDHVILALPGGPLVARCHDAARLSALLDAGVCPGGRVGRFSAHEHQLLLVVDAELAVQLATTYVVAREVSPTGAVAAFNLALPWHGFESCSTASDVVAPRRTHADALPGAR